jgi:hypothetical protein
MIDKYDVFISYRHEKGKIYASTLYSDLVESGFKVFWDMREIPPSEDFEATIINAISGCSDFVCFLSEGSFDRYIDGSAKSSTDQDKDYVVLEIDTAQKTPSCTIIPCCIQGFKKPEEQKIKGIPVLEKFFKIEAMPVGDNLHEFKNALLQNLHFTQYQQLVQDYYKTMVDPAFVHWESDFLIRTYSQETNYVFAEIAGKRAPVIVFPASPEVHYPFKEMCQREDLRLTDETDLTPSQDQYPEYKYIVYPNLRHPHLVGYYLDGYEFDKNGKIKGVKASTHKYVENIFTSHILDYELYDVYKKTHGDPNVTLKDFPLRQKIHQGQTIKDVIEKGVNRASLFSVQMAVISKNDEGEYEMAVMTRSENVAARPGFFQIAPAGGFELFDLEATVEDPDERTRIISKNFDVRMAVMREYIEELFDGADFDEAKGDDDWNRLKEDVHFQEVCHLIETGKASFEFLGVAVDLLSLRPELSFMLLIDDPDYAKQHLFRNCEAKRIERMPLEDVADLMAHSAKVVTGSQGLFYLLGQNKKYQEIIKRQK